VLPVFGLRFGFEVFAPWGVLAPQEIPLSLAGHSFLSVSAMHRRTVLKLGGGAGVGLFLSQRWPLSASSAEALPLKLEVALADGTLLAPRPLNQLYFLDLADEPLSNPARRVEAGILWSQVPLTVPFAIALKLTVEGFGEVALYADKAGRGFTPADFPLNLNLAFAQTRLHRVKTALEQWESQGFTFPKGIGQRLRRADRALHEAERNPERRDRLRRCNTSLVESLWAGEELVLAKAQQIIQRQHPRQDFLFGCNAFGHPQAGEAYDRAFRQLFNFATVPFYWKSFEPTQGKPQFAGTDATTDWLRHNRIAVKGHPLAWFHEAGIPDWVRQKPYAEVKSLLHRHIVEITSHYRDRIGYFDVINEAHAPPWANELHYAPEQFLELTQLSTEAARLGNPRLTRIINCCCLWAENVAYSPPPQRSAYRYLKDCLAAKIPFEVIGLQLYYPDQDLFEIDRLLERFLQLGKPIHITELGVSSATGIDRQSVLQDARGLWHRPWSQTIQADWIEQFYTLCYSKSSIQAITWWDFSDRGCFWPFGGLLDREMQPKESFFRLKTWLEKTVPKKLL
jgi:endo-1,4-beta-xylanase